MKYKALMLDVDGTTIPNERHGMPSPAVINAVNKAQKKIHIGIITGRPLYYIRDIVNSLSLTGPSITSGGAEIVDLAKNKIISQKTIPVEDLAVIYKTLQKYQVTFYAHTVTTTHGNKEYKPTEDTDLSTEGISIAAFNLPHELVTNIIAELEGITTISCHKLVGWEYGTLSVQISPAQATKQQGIYDIANLLGISPREIIGVGDGYNDFPLLMACGLKVAMGNAVEDLKAIADYIAPTVEEDGVADVIEKYVLNP